MKNNFQGEAKHLIVIVLLTIVFLITAFIITPKLSEKATEVSNKVVNAETKADELKDKQDVLMMKKSVETNRKNTIEEKQSESNKKIKELGITTQKKYLESSDTNIFYLFSTLVKIIDVNISELLVQDVDVLMKNENINKDISEETTETPATENTSSEEIVEEPTTNSNVSSEEKDAESETENIGTETSETPPMLSGYEVKTEKQVNISLYGDYTDIMLYFQMLDKLSDNFKLINLEVSLLILKNGYPVEDYQLTPNDYNFISGTTIQNSNKLDIFYYEDKLKEIEFLKKEQENVEKEAQIKVAKENELNQTQNNQVDSKYTATKEEIVQMSRYFGNKYGVPVPYILATIDKKSGFDPLFTVINPNGTKNIGLMQINENTAKQLAKLLGIEYVKGMEIIPGLNIEMGTMYLKYIAEGRSFDFNVPNIEDQHYILSAYNKGVSGVEEYAKTNKEYESSPYETEYSKSILAKMADYTLYEDESEIQPVDYTTQIIEYKNSVDIVKNENTEKEEKIEPVIINEDINNIYTEVTSVKATFSLINEGDNTLLLENKDFNFSNPNEKVLKDSSNNTYPDSKKLENSKYRKSELKKIKKTIRENLKNGLPIESELNYLRLITLYEMQ